MKYVINEFYPDKGIYKGVRAGKHLFQRHTANGLREYGPKYHKENVNN